MKIDALRHAIETLNGLDECFLSNEAFRDSYDRILKKAVEKGAPLTFETLRDVLNTPLLLRTLMGSEERELLNRIRLADKNPTVQEKITAYFPETKKAHDEWMKDFAVQDLKDDIDQRPRIVFPGKMNVYDPDASVESIAFDLIRMQKSPVGKDCKKNGLAIKMEALDALKKRNLKRLRKIAKRVNPPTPYSDDLENFKKSCLKIKRNQVNKLFALLSIGFNDDRIVYDLLAEDQKKEIFQALNKKETKWLCRKIKPVSSAQKRFVAPQKFFKFMNVARLI